MNNKNPKKGFTILVAVVTAGILLIIAMSIGGIALKEQILSTANKESQVAFYAADTGMECALYWDQKMGAFTLKDDNSSADTFSSIDCNHTTQKNIAVDSISGPSGSSPVTYSYSFKLSNIPVGDGSTKTCAVVKVVKGTGYIDDEKHPDPTKTYTDIYSYGYNTCDASLSRIERGIEGHY